MGELIILGTAAILILVYEVLPRATWFGESWRHLDVSGWDETRSRGVVRPSRAGAWTVGRKR